MFISRVSVLLSLIGIYIGIVIQHHLFIGYQTATGKDKALYSLHQLNYIEYSLIGIFALLLSIVSILNKENKKTISLTLSLSIIAILIFILEIWRIFI